MFLYESHHVVRPDFGEVTEKSCRVDRRVIPAFKRNVKRVQQISQSETVKAKFYKPKCLQQSDNNTFELGFLQAEKGGIEEEKCI